MATIEQISTGLSEIVNQVADVPVEDIRPDRSLTSDLDIDSLSVVEIMVAAEEMFGVRIPDNDLKGLSTIEDVATYIHNAQVTQAAQA